MCVRNLTEKGNRESFSIENLHAGAGPAGLEGAGPGRGSATSWAIALVVVLLLLALGWWSTTRGRRR